MPSIEQLKVLNAVVECGSLRIAAERLCKTQPALTHAIRQLESLLGLSLFSRDAYRLKLTDAGERIHQLAMRTLESHNELLQVAGFLAGGNEAQVTLAVEASFELAPILPAFEAVQAEFPACEIIIRQEYLTGAVELVQKDLAELCISPLSPSLSPSKGAGSRIQMQFLTRGEMVNVASPKLIARHSALQTVAQLKDEYQILVQDSGSGSRGVKFGVQTAQRHWYVNSFATKLSLIEQGMGWGRLPLWMIKAALDEGRLQRLELKDMSTCEQFGYSLARRADITPGPVAARLWQALAAIA
ncbi:LysR family transcriptional regulator [Shewanella sp. JM162201]|uniref:LysR family transcriptional regulator n=1 Tax=Shewanella jiangmenensis TaxID=2837387 RepID=A0ABS5V174_9GAMM|nr:LysR family transcriptional regulator [Shewanella jiangmenensis]MBT1443660.1 LysR family transcriptional regulator [Shewanella jiangmenensis]